MATDARYIVFSFPRLSRRVNRDMWLDRFVTSMLMNQDGVLPENTSWTLIHPDNWPDEVDFVPAHFDLVAGTSADMTLLEEKYHEYSAFMAQEYGDYAELDIEEFLPSEPVEYIPVPEDYDYTHMDVSAREAMAQFYESDDDDELEQHEEVNSDDHDES